MATTEEGGTSAANAIREWALAMADALRLAEERHETDIVLMIAPSNPKACPIEFRISSYGTFSVYAGEGFAFEEVVLSLQRLRELCEAIERGRVLEHVWTWRGTTVKTKGYIELDSGRMHDTGSCHWARLIGLGTRRTIVYEPYRLS